MRGVWSLATMNRRLRIALGSSNPMLPSPSALRLTPAVFAFFALLLTTSCSSIDTAGDDIPIATPSEPQSTEPVIELDHVYTYAPRGVTEDDVVATLRDAGLVVLEDRNEFPDGPVGRYVVLDHTYLEILWLADDAASDDEQLKRAANWESSGASPFGVGLRRRDNAPSPLPFSSRPMSAEWMRPGTEMRLLNREDEAFAPGLFVVPDYMAMTSWGSDPAADAASSGNAVADITGVRILTRPGTRPAAADVLSQAGVRFDTGDEPLMELTVTVRQQLRRTDLRPTLPIVLRVD
jgi:hypothetical protein